MKQYKNTRGFTLPELMITLGVIAIVLSTAVPGISSMLKDNSLANQLNSVVTDLHYARAEAAKRDVRVILCRSASPDATTPSCGGDTKVWESGYIIFADDGSNSNSVYNSATDTLPDGSTNESGSTAVMAVCDDRGIENGRTIKVGANGVPRMYADNIATCYP